MAYMNLNLRRQGRGGEREKKREREISELEISTWNMSAYQWYQNLETGEFPKKEEGRLGPGILQD